MATAAADMKYIANLKSATLPSLAFLRHLESFNFLGTSKTWQIRMKTIPVAWLKKKRRNRTQHHWKKKGRQQFLRSVHEGIWNLVSVSRALEFSHEFARASLLQRVSNEDTEGPLKYKSMRQKNLKWPTRNEQQINKNHSRSGAFSSQIKNHSIPSHPLETGTCCFCHRIGTLHTNFQTHRHKSKCKKTK